MGNWKPKIKQTELIDKCLEQIEYETGFHIINKQFGDGYWLMGGPKNCVCNFNIKEIPKFTFGIWDVDVAAGTLEDRAKYLSDSDKEPIWTDYIGIRADSKLVFFTQYTKDIDKFKPSRSGFVIGIKQNTWINKVDEKTLQDDGIFYMSDVIDCLKYMKKHPLKSYFYVGIMSNNIWDEQSNYKILKTYIKDSYYYYKNYIKEKHKTNKLIKVSKRFCKKLTQFNYYIENRVGWYPNIHIELRRKDNVDICKYNKEWDKLMEFDNKYGHLLSLYWYEYNLNSDLTTEELKKDKELKKTFNKLIQKKIKDYRENTQDEDYKLLAYNYNEEVM